MNVYEYCPRVENERYLLRLVSEQDCDDLLKVYSDTAAVPLFNSDNCNGDDFHYVTSQRMMEAICFWTWSYQHGFFVRWSILDKAAGCAVGTVELFHRDAEDSYNGCVVLRLDLRGDYEKENHITEILFMIVPRAYEWFGSDRIITKAKPVAAERIKALTNMGFVPGDAPLVGHDGTEYWDYWAKSVNQDIVIP